MRTLQPNIPFVVDPVTGSFQSETYVYEHITFQSFQIHIDGDLGGIFSIEVTNDENDPNSWSTVVDSPFIINSSVNPYHVTENVDACARYYRNAFTYVSGTGAATIIVFAKGNS